VTIVGTKADWEGALGKPRIARRPKRWSFLSPAPAFAFLRGVWQNAAGPLRTLLLGLLLFIGVSVAVFRVALSLSLVDAFYFIITTVTTTGYGDITPHEASSAVKLYACLVMVLGSAATATLYSIITDYLVTARFRELFGQNRLPREGHVVVAGLGDVGFRTADELRRAGAEVVAITLEQEGELVGAARSKVPVVIGDARQRDTLVRAGLDRAAAVLCLTGDDAVNLGIALAARQVKPGIRTVVRLFDPGFAEKARGALRLEAAMSSTRLAAPAFAAAALYPDTCAAFLDEENRFMALRSCPGSDWAGRKPSELRAEGMDLLLRRTSGGGWRVAMGDAPISLEERLMLVISRPLLW
jgi:Trk K+ transport system NAD-binding subunit